MVTMASAPVTASAADAAREHPASTARASASSLRSKARTSWPAFARFAAMPPPILPSPINAIFMSTTLPHTFAFLDERGHAFGLVLGGGEDLEQAAFVDQPLIKGGFERGVDHVLVHHRGHWGHRGDDGCGL